MHAYIHTYNTHAHTKPNVHMYIQEDENNMEIEKLAEVLRFERSDNQEMMDACTTFVSETAAKTVQRVFRGHIGRRKYKILKDIEWAKQAEHTALVLQAAYR